MSISKNIIKARENAGLNQSELARAIDVSPQSVQQWESGETTPRRNRIEKLASVLGVTVQELEFGVPDNAIKNVRGLPKDKYEFIPYYNISLSAGSGFDNGDYEEIKNELAFRKSWLREEGLNAESLAVVKVEGDSMLPRLHDSDLILVDTHCTDIQSSKIYAIRYATELRVKRLEHRYDGALIIKSDNQSPEYSDEIVPAEDVENIEVVGRVVRLVSGGGF